MNSKDLYLRLLRYVKPHRGMFALALLGIVLSALVEPLLPALVKPLLDGSFVEKDPFYITWMPIFIALAALARGLTGFVGEVAMKWVANRVVMDLRNDMFAKLLLLPDQRFADSSAGNLLSKFTYDVMQVMNATTQALVVLIRDTLIVIGLLAWIFYLNWRLSLIVLVAAPAIAVTVRLISRRLRRLSRELQVRMGDLNHVIDEAIQGQREIKVFGGQQREYSRFYKVNNWVRRYRMKLTVAAEASVPIVQFLAAIALATVIYIASQQALANEITVGGFVSLFGAMAMLLAPIKRLTKLNEQLQKALAAAESIFALIDEPPELDLGNKTLGTPRARGAVSFRGVDFRYPSNKQPVLKNLSLEVMPGETIALVGSSGSGKTTLVHLLARYYNPERGQVLLDGVDINELPLPELRAQIATVGQQVVLFNDTVAANIAYAAAEPDKVSFEALQAAAEQANALEFIQQLPAGFDTLIGENGTRLSGGQRQRIAIARALLKDAPLLVLDEATSALDSRAERQVQQALEHLRRDRTVFVVAHRLSTIENANRIVVLERGEVVEIGSHSELIERNGSYAQLYRLQQHNQSEQPELVK